MAVARLARNLFYSKSPTVQFESFKLNSCQKSIQRLSISSIKQRFLIRQSEIKKRSLGGQISFLFAATVFAKTEEKEVEDPLVMEVKNAKLLESRESFTLAEERYHAALRLNDERSQKGEIDAQKFTAHRAWILDAMASMAITENKPYKAEKLFKEVMQLLFNLGANPASPAVLEISLKLANIFSTMEEEDKQLAAESGFVFCIENQTKTVQQIRGWIAQGEPVPEEGFKESLALLGWAHESYARFLLTKSRFEDAIKGYNLSFQLAKEVYGEDSENYASMLNDTASILAEKNLFEPATKMLEESIAKGEGKGWEGEAAFIINLGIIQLQQKMLDQAQINCELGLKLGRKLNSVQSINEAEQCLSEVKKLSCPVG